MFPASLKLLLKEQIQLPFLRLNPLSFTSCNKSVVRMQDRISGINLGREQEKIKAGRFSCFLVLLFSFLDRQARRLSLNVEGEMNSSGNFEDPT